MQIIDLEDGAVLGKDLIVENRMLMKKGSVLNMRIITLLKNRNVKFVYIQSDDIEQHQAEDLIGPEEVVELHKAFEIEGVNPDFYKTLAELSTEIRYGHALKDKKDIIYLRDLFQKYMENVHYREMLIALKNHDIYSYMHAIDVFTLCTLFAKKEGIQNIEHYALGFLFHDIGKLKTPFEILKKEGKLSKKEFDKMKEHTEDGYQMLCDMDLESIAYLAKNHHEKTDGSGYPGGLDASLLPREVLILQLIDIYSAITLKRSYKAEIGAAEAIATIYKEKHLLDEKLLARFVDFIGIYPENAIVLLSDGTHALIESVNDMYPLLPAVKRLDEDHSFILPVDFQLTIHKMLSLYVEKPEQIFSKFSKHLISGEIDKMEKYYQKLKEEYSPFECFTKVYIPICKIFNIMKDSEIVDAIRLKEVGLRLKIIVDDAIINLRKDSKKSEAIIILVEKAFRTSTYIQLVEGIFLSKGIYPFLLNLGTNENELLKIANYCDASAICVISKEYEPILSRERKLKQFFIGKHELENFIYSFAGEEYREVDMELKLKDYKAVKKLLV